MPGEPACPSPGPAPRLLPSQAPPRLWLASKVGAEQRAEAHWVPREVVAGAGVHLSRSAQWLYR